MKKKHDLDLSDLCMNKHFSKVVLWYPTEGPETVEVFLLTWNKTHSYFARS